MARKSGSSLQCVWSGCIVPAALLWLLVSVGMSAGQDSKAETDLARLRATFEQEMHKVMDEKLGALSALQERYLSLLEVLEKKYQQQGMLEVLLQIQKERERFKSARSIPPEQIKPEIKDLAAAQNEFLSAYQRWPMDPARKILVLAGYYDKSLAALQAELTRQGDIPGAMLVKQERDGLELRREIVSARSVVTENDAAAKGAVPPVSGGDPAAPAVFVPTTGGVQVRTEEQLRRRFNDFAKVVMGQDWNGAMAYVSPKQVRDMGERMARGILQMQFGSWRMADQARSDIRVDSLTVAAEGGTAELIPKVLLNNQWRPLARTDWVQEDDNWYLSLNRHPGPAVNQGGDVPPQRPHRRR